MRKISLLLFLVLFVFARPTFAHRSGCHRWHSCPSDTGSYVCGDLGYTSGCGAVESVPDNTVQYVAPTEAQYVQPTVIPTRIPTRIPTPTPTKYIETELDRKKMFKVVSIIDGDTIDVSIRGVTERVRLLAIDTPETKDPRKPVQCFGYEATNKLKSLISGKFVKLTDDRSQGNRDKYKRLLRYVYDGNLFINREMVARGYAFSYKQYPTKFLEEFNALEKQAREENFGLWGACPIKTSINSPKPS